MTDNEHFIRIFRALRKKMHLEICDSDKILTNFLINNNTINIKISPLI